MQIYVKKQYDIIISPCFVHALPYIATGFRLCLVDSKMEGFANVQRILENQFQFSFRTGNVILDSMIAGMILTATTYLFSLVRNSTINYEFFLSMLGISYNKIIISGKPVKLNPKNEMDMADFTIKFKAVLLQVKKNGYANSGVHQLVEGPSTNSVSDLFIVAQTTTFTLGEDIFCKIVQDTKSDTRSDTPISFMAEISSKNKDVEELEKLFVCWIKEYIQHVQETGENKIELTGRLGTTPWDTQFSFSNKFLAVLHKMNNMNFDLPDIKILKEFLIEEPKERFGNRDGELTVELRKAENLLPEKCQIEEDVYCEVEWTKNKRETLECTIKITSDVLNVKKLTDLLSVWEKEFDDHNQVGDCLKYFVFNPPSDNKNNHNLYTEFSFESVKTFNNIFFSEKEELIERIEFFEENEPWFTERGIPYTFGILFHGEPGCGKTSTIKALANMTRRHIISVPLKNVKTLSDLYSIFYAAKVNNRTIGMDKRLYVLEDIDCGGLEDLVKKRKIAEEEELNDEVEKKSNTSDDSGNEEVEESDDKEPGKKKKKKEKEKELTLSDLLEVFDGVMESKVKE